MNCSKQQDLWERFKKYYTEFPTLGLSLDLSRMNFDEDFFPSMEPRIQKAFAAMAELEKGAIANPDENRMVGHYWLRNPGLAPSPEIRKEIENTLLAVKKFAKQVHDGSIQGKKGIFKNLLLVGIGGSALGPQFVSHALSNPIMDKLRLFTFDNTDPDGMERVLASIGARLSETLCMVVSKSGGTKETRNGMLRAKAAYEAAGLDFGQHSVAITQFGSELDNYAVQHNWIIRFPMWDWVGGRTSELSAVGLLPAALQGFDVDALVAGAKVCDEITRDISSKANPAAQLALAWFKACNGNGDKSMVVLPYKDRLELFSRYLQQLIMESLGKERDLAGRVVNQGINVFGNKGSTDQHAYVQQLRDGKNNFFAIFIEVNNDGDGSLPMEVEPKTTIGDFLFGFFLGTRQALFEGNRESITITIKEISAFTIGVLISLFERAVGFYASLININAYNQPGVEAGKKAAAKIISFQLQIIDALKDKNSKWTVRRLAEHLKEPQETETIFKICEHLAANPNRGIVKTKTASPFESLYQKA